jgi:hypothetical protein
MGKKPIVRRNYIIEGEGALVNEAGEETPLNPVILHRR